MKYEPYYVSDVINKSKAKRFTVISCFAGGGGSSTGYRLAGGDVLLINEFVEEAIKTYSLNYPDTKVLIDDIKQYSSDDFLSMVNMKPGELDILDGSPPCSAFSFAGKREKGWNKTKAYSDDKTIDSVEDLFLEFIRIASGIQPKIIIAENVKGITIGPATKKRNQFMNAFSDIGYDVTYKVINAANHGVPQARERAIFVCVRNDVASALDLNPITISSIFPTSESGYVSMEEAIGDIENDEDEVNMLIEFYENSFQNNFMGRMPMRPSRHLKPNDPQFREWNPKKSCFNMIRPAPHLPSPTLTQQGQQRGLSGVFHYENNRKLTIKEMKRLMSLPEDYELTGTFDQQAERIGRMVAPKMMAAVANSIYDKILKPYKEKMKP